jgi:membrane dipeptidase
MDANARTLHDDAIVIDGCCPLLVGIPYIDWYIEGGATVVTPTIGGFHPTEVSFNFGAAWLEYIRGRDDLVLIEKGSDVHRAKEEGKTGVVLAFQGTMPIGTDLNLVNAFKKMGVGIMQLTYNTECEVGYGAQVEEDKGLKQFGFEFIERCNACRVIVDCSHTGHTTSMDAIKASKSPVIFSHANPTAIYPTDSHRNITDDLIRAAAESGGVVGAVGFPGMLGGIKQPSIDDFINSIDHIVNVGGIDSASLGIDYYLGQHPVADEKEAEEAYQREVDTGRWKGKDYPPPPHYYPEGIETPRTLPHLTEALLKRGYNEEDTRKILGLNLVRVYEAVWG